jgi:hypothetical protein
MSGVLAELFVGGHIMRVEKSIHAAVEQSFQTHPMRRLTRSEVNRRFQICVSLIEILRVDMQWSVFRICDHLTRFLQMELDNLRLPLTQGADGWSVSTKDGTLSQRDARPYMTAEEQSGLSAGPDGAKCDTESPGGLDDRHDPDSDSGSEGQ